MASLAILGGFLVYGVKEDKAKHLFTVDEMQLSVGLSRDSWKRSPAAGLAPVDHRATLLPNPADPTRGFLVIEITSPTRPTWRTVATGAGLKTGKIRLSDNEVERLILARNSYSARLSKRCTRPQSVLLPFTGVRDLVSG